jgi:hypothetical protein
MKLKDLRAILSADPNDEFESVPNNAQGFWAGMTQDQRLFISRVMDDFVSYELGTGARDDGRFDDIKEASNWANFGFPLAPDADFAAALGLVPFSDEYLQRWLADEARLIANNEESEDEEDYDDDYEEEDEDEYYDEDEERLPLHPSGIISIQIANYVAEEACEDGNNDVARLLDSGNEVTVEYIVDNLYDGYVDWFIRHWFSDDHSPATLDSVRELLPNYTWQADDGYLTVLHDGYESGAYSDELPREDMVKLLAHIIG